MLDFMEHYRKKIIGAINGWDRIRFRGTIRWLASTSSINSYLITQGIRIKDFTKWAETITKNVRNMCAAQANRLDIPMIYLRSAAVDKEAEARKIMRENGVDVGDICMFSTVETCMAPTVRGNRSRRILELKLMPRKCIWIYHYWMDYYWSADETEWASDIVFRSAAVLDALFPKLARFGLLTAQSPAVMRFLGRKNKGPKANEIVSDLRRRYEGLRIKHWINRNSVKMYTH